MTAAELVTYFEAFADDFDAPVHEDSAVESVFRTGDGFTVLHADGGWTARQRRHRDGLDRPPAGARRPHADLRASIEQITPSTYRNPGQVADGGVLVVGASASGAQLADELPEPGARSRSPSAATTGCPAATGASTSGGGSRRADGSRSRSTRVRDPRRARVRGLVAAHRQARPSQPRRHDPVGQGRAAHRTVHGLRRHVGVVRPRPRALDGACPRADAQGARRHRRVHRPPRSRVRGATRRTRRPPSGPSTSRRDPPRRAGDQDRSCGRRASRRSYPWLHVPVLDQQGEIIQRRGVTPVPRPLRPRAAVPASPRLELHRRSAPRRRRRRGPHRGGALVGSAAAGKECHVDT